ncbi:hypothetical protein DENIS_0648 [Desulfonema ishimotonii]|uniref:Methyl-accepting transducer domain-containing protein n=1 Tax=Desulfonema ishimotonii TaxID=45657 RepID=A0A401FRV9_9BACT|nr:methyl-accepting chemotaxis protein [Desulfonema ishimotonii]GBC59707.1 hypothetical protein DENIS_0648 [Desulfonema ishimotonii]
MYQNLSIGKKITFITVIFSLAAIVPLFFMGFMAVSSARQSFVQDKFQQLVSIREIKNAQIQSYFNERRNDTEVLLGTIKSLRDAAAEKLKTAQELKKNHIEDLLKRMETRLLTLKSDPYLIDALADFTQSFRYSGNRVDTPEWTSAAGEYDPRMKDIIKTNGWSDIFLISTAGEIVYTTGRKADLGMSVPNSDLRNTGIGKAFETARMMAPDAVAIGDFKPYPPSGGTYAAFMLAQMRDTDGELRGYIGFRIPTDRIGQIMRQRQGMGVSGESYLIGKSDGRIAFRSVMTTMGDGKYTIGYDVTDQARSYVHKALAGETGMAVFTDSDGKLVMVAYAPLDFQQLSWACISKIDLEEAIVPPGYFESYIRHYQYYDLFLIHPKGEIFYTVMHEPDYKTNIIDGPYAESGLGKLVRRISGSGQFGFQDFEPYAPSNNQPAAFIARPLVIDGQPELIVALQLSIDPVNRIMQERSGMGKTGESYLVGSDKLMRSDKYLDAGNYSVTASFAEPEKSKVETEASRRALDGHTESGIVRDTRGQHVLSAYKPVDIGGFRWALIVEIDEAEVRSESTVAESLLKRVRNIGLISLLIVTGIIFMNTLFNKHLIRMLNRTISEVNGSAEQVSSASAQVAASGQLMARGAAEQAASVEETSASLNEMAATTRQNAGHANEVREIAASSEADIENAGASMAELIRAMAETARSSREASKIIKTIDDIAFQTNLLALNASVEAARAGEAGAGFAVVANEVRNLALKTTEAARETSDRIEGTVRRIGEGTLVVEKTNAAFGKVVSGSEKIVGLVSRIASASHDQARGIEAISIAISEVEKVSQQNSVTAEESASASEEMTGQARQMKRIAEELSLRVGVQGGEGTPAAIFQNSGLQKKRFGV